MNFPFKKTTSLQTNKQRRKDKILSVKLEILSINLEVKALYLLINQDLKIIKTVFMPGQKKGKKFMMSKRENEVKEKIQQPL